ncbi:hypothetical protein LG198_14225 [Methylobacillus arboreus]|uniref:hypothetical protein n=1 Tax=Methylobacillus arboreus TaxID=755170 RepID=UPI001E2C1EC1|nr:hypothetical protein [Methylobacillus arboreus]MCB5191886.1 hypothetical protein [Methylobacillus arboreus]
MSYIGQSYVNDRSNAGQFASNNNVTHQQAWLRVMEQSGLYEALQKTQVVQASVQNAEADAMAMPSKAAGKPQEIADLIAEHGGNTPVPQPAEQIETLVNHPAYVSNIAGVKAMVSALSVVSVPNLNSEPGVLSSNGNVQRTAVPFTEATRVLNEWALRNIAILQGKQGVEVWIRDARLGKEQASRLNEVLGEIRGQMGLLGANLVKVMLNGKQVFAKVLSANNPTVGG